MKYILNYLKIVNDLLANEQVQKLRLYKHHYAYTRFEHCLSVSYYSYLICKFLNLDYISAARAGLLHDLFFYDCECKSTRPKSHLKNHPKISLYNAQKILCLNKIEKDIILKHMWPITILPPRFLESYIVCFVDKFCALREFFFFCTFRNQFFPLILALQFLFLYH